MDPDRVRSYLQVACAGLGFDIGEVWWMSNENGTSTVASITETTTTTNRANENTTGGESSAINHQPSKPPKKRFLQLYTSKAYCNQRSKLVQPHDDVDMEFDNDNQTSDNTSTDSAAAGSSSSHQLVLHNKNTNQNSNHPMLEDDEHEHVLSPRIVEAVTKSAQVVWANSQNSQSEKGGLLGRSDIKLQTAIGMPVGIDDAGHVWVVVMFSPKNIQSSHDAIEYLQYIGRSAGTTSIPCLLPVVGDVGHTADNRMIANGNHNEQEENADEQQSQQTPHHFLVSIKPPQSKQPTNSYIHTQDILGEGVTAKFVSFNIHDDDDDTTLKDINDSQLASTNNGIIYPQRTPSPYSINDLRNAPKDDFGIPMLPSAVESHLGVDNTQNSDMDNLLITDAFDEASYGVWSTIMNSASGHTIRTSTTIASKMEVIRERLEEFLCAFLGMSVFDVGDAWVLSSADNVADEGTVLERAAIAGGNMMNVNDDKRKALKCLFSVAATESNTGINELRMVSENSSIQIGDGAVGQAFSSGYPVWSSDKSLIYDSSRYHALENCNIETVFAVPIFSAGDVSPSCILSCYSLLHSESVPFVINFVQKAVRLLWDGLDQIDPHESVGRVLWNNVGPSDLGEMAADLEMQKAFIGKKRPHSDVNHERNDDPNGRYRSSPFSTAQTNGIHHFDNALSPSPVPFYPTAASPHKGLAPAPLFPTSVMAPNSQQMVSVNFSDDGHWAVQQAVKSIGDFQLWTNTNSCQQYSDGLPAQQGMHQELNQVPQYQPHFQPLQRKQEFTSSIGVEQLRSHQTFVSSDTTLQPLSQPPNISLAYVDYGLQSQSGETKPPVPAPSVGVHIEHPSVIHANLMEFNALAQMYSVPDPSPFPNDLREPSIQHAAIQPPSPNERIDNIRVVPLSQSEGSVILTGPQQMIYCTANAQPVDVESMDQSLFSLDIAKKCRIAGCPEQTVPRKPYCSKHCGNRQCEREGCSKHAQGATRFCIAHGGGRRCTFPGCDKGARDRYFCAA
eukprot:CCRYP_013493-RB/>CCRYP_013493-RB protein AED:0.05 eAED:0.05 QI:494/1/1/1/0.5/0.4/5/1391/1011